MSLFEYVIVLVSVVLSLGIARILENHAHLLKLGPKVRWSPTYLLWLLIIFFSHVDLWASLWLIRGSDSWTLLSVLGVLLAAVALFYASILSAPELEPGQSIDLWAFHLDNSQRKRQPGNPRLRRPFCIGPGFRRWRSGRLAASPT